MILSDEAMLTRMSDMELIGKYNSNWEKYKIEIEPWDINALQGASVDLKLGSEIINERREKIILSRESPNNNGMFGYLLGPGDCCLASTLERVRIPLDCVGRVEGKSSIGRRHTIIHCTAGWIDPGYEGNITLEVVNHSNHYSYLLELDMFICQLTFLQLDQVTSRPYKGKYTGENATGTVGHR